ncbi:TIGR01244 family sulfur transferase [Limnobacter sp.]|uniref:TIGR01244 family sulfur transferase n=1 Tax=Limnobacter sp. TaxID=2003368 RepID=UPI0035151EF9
MSIRKLSEDVAVCGQIRPEDVPHIAALGFKTIINNRPDGEAADQPAHADIEAAAKAAGLAIHYLPMSVGAPPSLEVMQAFNQILESASKPVLAYCRSGNRSGQIYMGACALPKGQA